MSRCGGRDGVEVDRVRGPGMFEKNVGGLDRQIRFVAGTVLLAVALAGIVTDVAGQPVALIALAGATGLLFNAVAQRCLLNRLLGVDTCGEAC